MAETENIPQINSYKDFIQQLGKIKNSETSVIISFYKYCYLYGDELDFNGSKELILMQLEKHGLKPYKVTGDLNLIFRYKKYAEAVMLIKPYAVDFSILKHWCGSS